MAAFEQALERAQVPHRVVTYPGAPHSFFDRKQAEFADASAQAWAEVRAFIGLESAAAERAERPQVRARALRRT